MRTRRAFLQSAVLAASALPARATKTYATSRPPLADRKFTSDAVEAKIQAAKKRIADPELAWMFENCFPNTLDTTVRTGELDGKPDSFVITGDIDAMWLRDSAAQVWPYLPLAKDDARLKTMLAGVVNRQARSVRIDPYANAFNFGATGSEWSGDHTRMKAELHERKWEIDSLCFPVRLAYGYWQVTVDAGPYDAQWRAGADTILRTFTEQQRKQSPGPYSFQRKAESPYDTQGLSGFGNPARPNGMIFSMFRPSDDACIFPLLVPSNLFAAKALGQLAELAAHAAQDTALAARATALSDEVAQATARHGRVNHPHHGKIWAYEVDGYGGQLLMDDANAPGLVTLAYLGICPTSDAVYQRTRKFALSDSNPYFFRGTAAEGVGGPHIGLNSIWPMSIMYRAFTSTDDAEIRQCLRWLRDTTAGTGFMHESFNKDNPSKFTRSWFAWANTLFGELMMTLAEQKPTLLAAPLS